MGYKPNLERHHRVVAALTLTLGVKEPLGFICTLTGTIGASGRYASYWNAFLVVDVCDGVFSGEALSTVRVHRGGALTEAGRLHPPPGLLFPVPHALAGRWSHHHTGVTERRVLQRYLHERE